MRKFFSQNLIVLSVALAICSCRSNPDPGVIQNPSKPPEQGAEPPSPNPSPNPLPDNRSECFKTGTYPYIECLPLVSMPDALNITQDYLYLDPALHFTGKLIRQYQEPDRLMDLSLIPGNLHISPHFQVQELMRQSSGRFGLFSSFVIGQLEQIRIALGRALRINSGYRSPGHNSKISGSSQYSRHMYGEGVDLSTPTDSEREEVRQECEKTDADLVILYVSHVHCDWRMRELDLNFYDPSPLQLPEESRTRKDRLEDYARSIDAKILQEDGMFTDSPDEVRFSVEGRVLVDDQEGPLWIEWKVTSPSGNEARYTGPQIRFRPEEKGTYEIWARAGGYTELRSTFDFNSSTE